MSIKENNLNKLEGYLLAALNEYRIDISGSSPYSDETTMDFMDKVEEFLENHCGIDTY